VPYPRACEEKASCNHERTQLRVKVLGDHIGAGRGRWRKQVVPERVAAVLLVLEAAVNAFAPAVEPPPAVSKGPLISRVQPDQARAETCLSEHRAEHRSRCVAGLSEAQYPRLGKAVGLQEQRCHAVGNKQRLGTQDWRANGKLDPRWFSRAITVIAHPTRSLQQEYGNRQQSKRSIGCAIAKALHQSAEHKDYDEPTLRKEQLEV